MKLVRRECQMVIQKYEMDVTPEYVKDVENYINETYELEGGPITLTELDLVTAWDRCTNETLSRKVIARKDSAWYVCPDWQVGDIVSDILSDDMWSQDADVLDSRTDEVEDYVENYSENLPF